MTDAPAPEHYALRWSGDTREAHLPWAASGKR